MRISILRMGNDFISTLQPAVLDPHCRSAGNSPRSWKLSIAFIITIAFGPAFSSTVFAHGGHKAEHNHPFPTKKFSTRRGKGIYNTYCASCHGLKGDGQGPAGTSLKPVATDFLDLRYMTMRSRVDHYEAVTNGRPNTAMMGWKKILTEEQIWDVITYIEHLFNHQWMKELGSPQRKSP